MISRQSEARRLPLRPLGLPSTGIQWAARPSRGTSQPTSPSNAPLLQGDQFGDLSISSPTNSDTAPKRPTSSSWEEAATNIQFAKSEVVKPSQTIIEMVDLEQEESHHEVIEEEVHGKEDEARQMAQAMGVEKLYDSFHSLYREDCAPVDKLCELFEAAGLTTSHEKVDAAVAKLYPEVSTTVSFKQCQELFLHLQQQRQKAEIDPTLVKGGRLARWMASLSDKEATNLLLLVVVTLCCISAFLAGGLAILLMVIDDTQNLKGYLQENLAIIQDTLEVYSKQIAAQEADNRALMFVTTMSSILQNAAFTATLDANIAQLSRVTISVGDAISAWWASEPRFANLASVTALLTNASLAKFGRNRTTSALNQMSAGLPDGYELLLGQWKSNSTSDIEFLTQLRYASSCTNGVCMVDKATSAPMKAALAGKTSSNWATDYRGATVYAGYSNVSSLAVQLNVLNTSLLFPHFNEMLFYTDAWTADQSNTWEYMLGYMPSPGVRVFLSTIPGCDAACSQKMLAPGMPLTRAINGETNTTTYTNFRGVKSVVTYAPVPNTPLGLAIHMAYSDIVQITLIHATSLVDTLNADFPFGSEEFELTMFTTQRNVTNFTRLSAYKHSDQCKSGQCIVATDYIQQAAKNCSTGVMRTTDYRGVQVLVGYSCISEVSAILSFKMDLDDEDADILSAAVEAVDSRTDEDTEISAQFLVAKPKTGLTAAQVKGYGDFDVVSRLKYPESCVHPNCTWNRESALSALQSLKDVVDTSDYRNVKVLAAPSRSAAISYGIGLAVEQDQTEAFQPMIDVAVKVAAFTGGMVVGSTILLIVLTKLFLKSMIKAKEEGNKVVEVEKERFSKLVSSMYPKFVVPQLLDGDKQLVCEVPGAAVFFSDIHEFTSASNTMGSEELLRLMGYVYGVMDFIGDTFGVYKVKTIGDAYLAVRGLPGSDSENPSLELLRYASFVCQVFGDRFVHPTEGQVLALMNSAMKWNGGTGTVTKKETKSRGSKSKSKGTTTDGTESVAPSMSPSKAPSKRSRQSKISTMETEVEEDKVQCIMSYGLAVGKIVAGVLAGRCPMFDIWGGTVNLASRMQSTGEPGRIQVSEKLYKKVIAVPGQPFSFEAPRSTFCKGFGTVNAYMVKTTTEGLPKDLQAQLGLEPLFGDFFFDNILTTVSRSGDGPVSGALQHPKALTASEIPAIVLSDSEGD